MPARDIYHNAVRNALVKDGWTITRDPFPLKWGQKDMYVDLGAERMLAAEKDEQKIAVEVKSFRSASEMRDLEQAMGQFVLYQIALRQQQPDYILHLAVPQEIVEEVFLEPLGQLLLEKSSVRVIGFDPEEERIISWTP